MRKTNQLWEIRPGQERTLLVLIVVLLAALFRPAIEWLGATISRANPIHTSEVEVTIPVVWWADRSGEAIVIWKACLTIFCEKPRSSIKILVESTLAGNEQRWERRVEAGLPEKGFIDPHERRFHSLTVGDIRCIESMNRATRGLVGSACLAPESGLVASFVGVAADVKDFYFLVTTARVLKGV